MISSIHLNYGAIKTQNGTMRESLKSLQLKIRIGPVAQHGRAAGSRL